MAYTCTHTVQEVKGLEQKLTVGQHVFLNCTGDDAAFEFAKATFKDGGLKLFKAESAPGALKIDMTFYKAGHHDFAKLALTDGTNEIFLGGPTVTVESVLKPSMDGKPPQPFDYQFPIPVGHPVALGLPLSYLIYLSCILLLVLGYSIFKGYWILYYSRLKTGLAKYSSPVDPDTQFYKSVRTAEKAGYPLDQLERAFRVYNLRVYKLPLFDLPDDRIIRYFRRNYPEYKNTRVSLQKILNEFSELSKNNSAEREQKTELVKKIYRYVENNRGLSQ